VVRPGVKLSEIGRAIDNVAHRDGFSVVRDFFGHGIGTKFHEAPSVFHFHQTQYDCVIEEGMIFTVEPMINAGDWKMKVLQDGWTAVTRDKSLSAQFEHTIGITKDGYEIFTLSPKGYTQPPYI
jgi:methionyl aminopeptidase